MTHSGLAALLDRARNLVIESPTPDKEVEPDKEAAVEEAVEAVVSDVVKDIIVNDPPAAETPAEVITKPSDPEWADEGEEATVPAYAIPTPVEMDAVKERKERKAFTPSEPEGPASYRQKRFLSSLALVRIGNELHPFRMLFEAGDERRADVDDDWDAGLASEAISALLKLQQFEHPSGFTLYPNKEYIAKRSKRR